MQKIRLTLFGTPGRQKLKMIFFPKNTQIRHLPEGYTVRNFRGDEDILPWVELCKNGLLADDAGEEAFAERITNVKGVNATTDLFFIEKDGKPVATVTAVDDFVESGLGCIHMVSVATEARGHGIGLALCEIAEKKLSEHHVQTAYLVTDDWRKAACKSYLKAGFFPVNYDSDMADRWSDLLTQFGIDSVMMVTDDGKEDKRIYSK